MTSILFDIDGVLYEGNRAVEGAAETIQWCQNSSIPHLFLTNTTSRSRIDLVDKLAQFGIKTNSNKIITPAVVAAKWLKENTHGDIAILLPESTKTEFDTLPVVEVNTAQRVSAIVVGDLGEQWGFSILNRTFQLLMEQPKPILIALGMSRYWKAEDGLRLDTAPFVVALEHASDVHAVVVGKPAATFFQAALTTIAADAENTIMIGDDIRSDVGAAQALGIKGILVQTGKYKVSDLEQNIEPDAVIKSIADLPKWWDENMKA